MSAKIPQSPPCDRCRTIPKMISFFDSEIGCVNFRPHCVTCSGPVPKAGCLLSIIAIALLSVTCLAGVRDQVNVAEAEAQAQSMQRRQMDSDFKIEKPAGAIGAVISDRYEITVSTSPTCGPCFSAKNRDGDGDSEIHLNWVNQVPPKGIPEMYPTYHWKDAKGQIRYVQGVTPLAKLLDIIERNDPPKRQMAPISSARRHRAESPTAGSGIQFHCRAQTERAFAFIRKYIGEGVPIRLEVDLSGENSFPLLKAGTDYSLLAVLGRSGRVELSAEKSELLLIKSIGFGYRVDGDDLLIDADAIRFEGLADKLSPKPSAYGAEPVGFEPMTLLTIFSVADALWKILHPSCDLELGGNITLEAVLVGDVITVSFSKCPKLRITAYWQWLLGVDKVTVSLDPAVPSVIDFANEPGIMFPIKRRQFTIVGDTE